MSQSSLNLDAFKTMSEKYLLYPESSECMGARHVNFCNFLARAVTLCKAGWSITHKN